MQYTRLGNSGLIVSRPAFGVMTFGHVQGQMAAVWKAGQEEANALVERSLDAASWMSSPAPTPLYPNWFQTFATDAAVRDALEPNRKS